MILKVLSILSTLQLFCFSTLHQLRFPPNFLNTRNIQTTDLHLRNQQFNNINNIFLMCINREELTELGLTQTEGRMHATSVLHSNPLHLHDAQTSVQLLVARRITSLDVRRQWSRMIILNVLFTTVTYIIINVALRIIRMVMWFLCVQYLNLKLGLGITKYKQRLSTKIHSSKTLTYAPACKNLINTFIKIATESYPFTVSKIEKDAKTR